VKESGHGLI